MIRTMERFDAIGRMKPSREAAPATAPPSPKATMTQDVVAMFGLDCPPLPPDTLLRLLGIHRFDINPDVAPA